uniref:Uncharacterized protein n=1 Tax=Rousettus aegyptiacus TaxID=9407 RepID=A0A7J8HSU4_ROUAE|nr:hypothetical protein HJG63_010945 [Rousettus aegyptiacus]
MFYAHAAGPGCCHSVTLLLSSRVLQRGQLLPLGDSGTGQAPWERGQQASSQLVTMCHGSLFGPEENHFNLISPGMTMGFHKPECKAISPAWERVTPQSSTSPQTTSRRFKGQEKGWKTTMLTILKGKSQGPAGFRDGCHGQKPK